MLRAFMRAILPFGFFRTAASLVLAAPLLGCAAQLNLSDDLNSAGRYGLTGLTPLPLPNDMDHPAITIPRFTIEGYDATILAVESGWVGSPNLFIVEEVPLTENRTNKVLAKTDRFAIPARDVAGGLSNIIGINGRHGAGLFRGHFDPLRQEAEPILVMAVPAGSQRVNGPKSWPVNFTVYRVAQVLHNVPGGYYRASVFEPLTSWQTSGRYCDEWTALRRVFGIRLGPDETADGCYPSG